MDEEKSIEYWQGNADSWTQLSRQGYDICRDHINMPAFKEMLPEVGSKLGLDIGCGEGTNTRTVAKLGASMVGIDPSSKFVEHANDHQENEHLEIEFKVGKASALDFSDSYFDFVMSTMVFMDVPNLDPVLKETSRVLKPDGFLQFSIVHPCFSPPKSRWMVDDSDNQEGVLVGQYFKQGGFLDQWTFTTVPEHIKSDHSQFKVLHYHRTLSQWINSLVEAGFTVEKMAEPTPSQEAIKAYPSLKRLEEVAWFLHIRARNSKPNK